MYAQWLLVYFSLTSCILTPLLCCVLSSFILAAVAAYNLKLVHLIIKNHHPSLYSLHADFVLMPSCYHAQLLHILVITNFALLWRATNREGSLPNRRTCGVILGLMRYVLYLHAALYYAGIYYYVQIILEALCSDSVDSVNSYNHEYYC